MNRKVIENRLRRKLDRMGYRLIKSRVRDPDALTFGGYQIEKIESGQIVAGSGNLNRGYALTIDQVSEWISTEQPRRPRL